MLVVKFWEYWSEKKKWAVAEEEERLVGDG